MYLTSDYSVDTNASKVSALSTWRRGLSELVILGLPHHYINTLITAHGHAGAFHQFEIGLIDLPEFVRRWDIELNDVELGNAAYKKYCEKNKVGA
jgi:hypothetical protein